MTTMTHLQIVSHRGFWTTDAEKNTTIAFNRALERGFGIETDVRDCSGTLVISHNPPTGDEPTLADFLELYAACTIRPVLALNIKADGLHECLAAQLRAVENHAAFVFDMSVPDTLGYLRLQIPVFVRQSEYEPVPALYDQAAGVWLDAFCREWFTVDDIEGHLGRGKKVCLVSPELHGRPHLPFWHRLRESTLHTTARLLLCTDFPLDAQEFFAQSATISAETEARVDYASAFGQGPSTG